MSENSATYTVCFSGWLVSPWPAPSCVTELVEGYDPHARPTTTLTLSVFTQEQLMGILNQLNTLGLPLLAVRDLSWAWRQGEAQTTYGQP